MNTRTAPEASPVDGNAVIRHHVIR